MASLEKRLISLKLDVVVESNRGHDQVAQLATLVNLRRRALRSALSALRLDEASGTLYGC